MSTVEVRFWAATDVGRTRDHNEDNFLVDKKLNLFIVADGMGGHAAGEVASSVAVREVRRIISEERQAVEGFVEADSVETRRAVLDLIDRAIRGACARVFQMAQESPERRGMGTTLSMLLVAGRRGFIGHVGDSRIYLLRTGQVHQLTEDHSLINELIKRGRLKPGDAFDSPYRNAVTRAVGVYETVEVDTFDFDVLPEDSYLLCSDGLSGYLDEDGDHITADALSMDDVKAIPESLIRYANESGGKDNITAIVVRTLAADEDEGRRRAAEVKLRLDTLRSVPLFRYLGYKGLVKIHNLVELRSFDADEVLFAEGSRGDALFVVLDGRVVVSQAGQRLTEVGPGGHLGELALVEKAPRQITARALERTRTLVLRREPLFEAMSADARLSMKVLWAIVQGVLGRLHVTRAELNASWRALDQLRRAPSATVEMPMLAPELLAAGALPVDVTDELVPGFLFQESEAEGTDPLLRPDSRLPAVVEDPDAPDEALALTSQPPRAGAPAALAERVTLTELDPDDDDG
ncbi:MAG: Stp1/IreP family PP2C-type Ser/Thr phosphatase [Myxococcales bacterium]|nr:Stp1/IreP family PP2C-type Ser/Thr phosphatase [Myxococcales bacterium]MCB9522083.1 Stp1/IreP family PP2C-type Ser/Thr phosphatase [Myxococcales bacterium]